MTKGVLIFAHNSTAVDYGMMAVIAGGLAKKHLKVPVSLVADTGTLAWMEETKTIKKAKKIFDKIISIDLPYTTNNRKLHDGLHSQVIPFINSNRCTAWQLTPYDTTLLIDSDFLIFSDRLNQYWDVDSSIMIAESLNDLRGGRAKILDNKVSMKIKGQTAITAGDIAKFTPYFEILNPELVICNLDSSKEVEIDLVIEKGRGYVAADEPRANELPFGHIATDAIYTPIKNVKFSIENTRVEQKTDYEKLVLDIETDGSIHPEDALKGAAYILIQHFMLFSDQTMTFETPKAEEDNVVDEELLHMRKLLKTSLADLDLSVRAYNCLKSADVRTLGELAKLEISDMMKFRNFGKKSLTELEQLIEEKGLTFGMDVSKYRLDED